MNYILLVNDPVEHYGDSDFVARNLMILHPELGWFEIAGGKRLNWSKEEIDRLIVRTMRIGKLLAIVVSDVLEPEQIGGAYTLAFKRKLPIYLFGNELVSLTAYKNSGGSLSERTSLVGHPYLDTPVEDLQFSYVRTANLVDLERRMGRVKTVRDLIKGGIVGLKKIDGMGKTTIDDVTETIFKQLGLKMK